MTHATTGGRLDRTPAHKMLPSGRNALRAGEANLIGWSRYDVSAWCVKNGFRRWQWTTTRAHLRNQSESASISSASPYQSTGQ